MTVTVNKPTPCSDPKVLVAALFKQDAGNSYLLTEKAEDSLLISTLHSRMQALGFYDARITLSESVDNSLVKSALPQKKSWFEGSDSIMMRLYQAAQNCRATILLYIPVSNVVFDQDLAHSLVDSLVANPDKDLAVSTGYCIGLEAYAVRVSALQKMVEAEISWPFYAEKESGVILKATSRYWTPDVLRPNIIRKVLSAQKNNSDMVSILNDKELVLEYFMEPESIGIEPTCFCNLKCPGCPHGTGKFSREKGYMDYSKYEKMVQTEIPDYVDAIALYYYGESFLHKDIFKMTKAIKNQTTTVSTNCVFFHREEHLLNILQSGLTDLTVCLDGATEETFSQYRVGISFDEVKQGIATLMRLKKEMNIEFPRISLQFIIMKHNMHEIELIKEFAEETGVDRLLLKKTVSEDDALGDYERDYDVSYEPFLGHSWVSSLGTCSSPSVCWDGTVAPCCVDHNAEYPLGNAFDTPLEDIFKGEKRVSFLKAVLEGNNPFCEMKNCRLYRGLQHSLSELNG